MATKTYKTHGISVQYEDNTDKVLKIAFTIFLIYVSTKMIFK